LVNVKAEHKAIDEDLTKVLKAHQQVESLKPKVLKQEEFEKQRETLRNLISESKSAENQVKTLETKVSKLRDRYRDNQQEKNNAEEKSVEAKHLNDRQKRSDELQKQLADLRAKLESDQKFQDEIRNGLCPILSEKCLNLDQGQTLEEYLSNQFSDTISQISSLVKTKKELSISLSTSREAQKFLVKLNTLTVREEEIKNEGLELKKEKESLEKSIQDLDKRQNELIDIEKKLETLENPKVRLKILEKEVVREIPLREKKTKIESNLERLESDRRLAVEELESYKDIDSKWEEFSSMRDKSSAGHRVYVANEAAAESLPEKLRDLETIQKDIRKMEKSLKKAEKDFEEETKGFKQEEYDLEKRDLAIFEKDLVEADLNHQHLKNSEYKIKTEIKHLKEIKASIRKEVAEKTRLEEIGDLTAFIRKTLKEAAPRVARNYVYHVSIEANQMFREITGNAERTLKWADDYGILLEEDGYDRPFPNLSGGEQMAAALSVRLALLKQLSDVKIAFFDEPTMNMDAEHRERLAEQISQITQKQTFDQLFVISHDDTFESYVDNILVVGE